ncbi:hypothetical protein D5018_08450 [Parashewanella curva]|uniref:Uncharacterized protein n=1 Tax=Parashewanella curva TaxID=2338552 RepID=A0A3L8PXW4_9GAMM|nr:hypothetical protein [Parashewanella curva]RLV60154.1 hypothetical protein D5018_08450 [Parashewanella curva]
MTTFEAKFAFSILSSKTQQETIEKLRALIKDSPDNKYLNYQLLSMCVIDKEHQCSTSVIDFSIENDKQNAAVWILKAQYELNNNHSKKLEEAIIEAANAALIDTYWGESYGVFDSAIEQVGVPNSLQSKMAAIGMVAALPMSPYHKLIQYCKNLKLSQAEMIESCLLLGKQLSYGKATLLENYMGYALQEHVHKRFNNTKRLDELKQEKQRLTETMNLFQDATSYLFLSNNRTSEWMLKQKEVGELEAATYIVEEAIRLSADPNFDPCKVDW